jgi:hypothetical protein
VCLLPDVAATRETMADLHDLLAAGAPPASALADLTAAAEDDGHRWDSLAAIAAFGVAA